MPALIQKISVALKRNLSTEEDEGIKAAFADKQGRFLLVPKPPRDDYAFAAWAGLQTNIYKVFNPNAIARAMALPDGPKALMLQLQRLNTGTCTDADEAELKRMGVW